MNGQQRREKLREILLKSEEPVSGTDLAKLLGVSRQAIVSDIALLRANGEKITATTSGYVLKNDYPCSKVFKVVHSDDDARRELITIVDCGGVVKDVFVYHKVYGVVRAQMNIRSRLDAERYLESIKTGKSSLLKNITSNYHYHTVLAENEDVLKLIEDRLWQEGFLAALQDYEPVDFT